MSRYYVLFVLLAALYLPGVTLAQQPAAATPAALGSLTGTVLDSLTQAPVPYATVVLLPPAPNDKAITGVAADDQGRFALTKLTPGPARLRVSYVGYGTKTRAVTITAGAMAVGAFRLPTASTTLGEAVVIGTKPVVEVRIDRLVYNADQDVTNTGGTAADVLRKAPLLAVDGEGNVKMRGSGNFKVLVNNKPSPTLANNLAEALKGIPADQIKTVEIITSPPAKYDGEGTAGIINIVLKKGVENGLNGRVGVSGGNRNSGLNTGLNFKKRKLGFTSSLSGGLNYAPSAGLLDRTGYTPQGTTQLTQRSTGRYNGSYYYGTVGLDYDFSDHQSVSVAGSLNGYRGPSTDNLVNSFVAPDPTLNRLFTRATSSTFQRVSGELSGTYTRTFAQARREWSVLGQISANEGSSSYDLNQYNNVAGPLEPSQADYRERSRNRTPGHEYTAQTDFTQPFGDKRTLEMGLKAIWRRTGATATVDGFMPGRMTDFEPLPDRGTDFSYDQDVQSAYASYSFAAGKKLNLSLGSRLERTALAADFRTTQSSFGRSYLTLLPNGAAQYAISQATSMRLAYGRRITRPYIYYLNPYVDRRDSLNISYGNPNLAPELTDSYELSFNTGGKAGSLNVAGSVRHTGNAIEGVLLPTGEVGITARTYANVASNVFYQLNLYGSTKPAKGWDVSGGPDLQYIVRRSPTLGITRAGFAASLNFNTSYKLPRKYTVQAFFYGALPGPELQGRGLGYLFYSVGGKKVFWQDKADLTLNISNPFTPFVAFGNTYSTPFLTQRQEYRAYQRGVRLSFNYRFGQAQQSKQRKRISNDDVKGGGGGQQSGQ
ncbi:TonB-dependent receptor [Hymenobacter sp. DH14]|uniref:TonB-dependent receptor n=1 Tax=Hymenobacter cyanobacteriorum TaxID=2926463 RepID=A0A9X1VDD0_9BACT|nr:TonB-dependent receptor [Hymenobacter cyanobacteriorum]MCI1186627.1 TonB-dependent receptor [Hymenobacter cyanobacteriorum]